MCSSDYPANLRSLNYALNVEIFTKKWFKIINNLYVNNTHITKFWNCDILAFHRRNFLVFGFSNPDEHRLWGIKPLMSGPICKGMLLLPARCDLALLLGPAPLTILRKIPSCSLIRPCSAIRQARVAWDIGYHSGKLLEIWNLKNIVRLVVFRADPYVKKKWESSNQFGIFHQNQ